MSIKAIVAINIAALIFMSFVLVMCASWINRYRKYDTYNFRHDNTSTAPLVAEKIDMETVTSDHGHDESASHDDTTDSKRGKRVHFQHDKPTAVRDDGAELTWSITFMWRIIVCAIQCPFMWHAPGRASYNNNFTRHLSMCASVWFISHKFW